MDEGRDRLLLSEIARRETSALSALYDRHAAGLYSLAVRMAGSGAGAEAVLTEVFGAVWSGVEPHDPRRGSVATWLRSMTRLRALRRRRADGVPAGDPPHLASRGSDSAGDPMAAGLSLGWTVLPTSERDVVALAYFDGLSIDETAALLGQPAPAVKEALQGGMHKLRASSQASVPGSEEACTADGLDQTPTPLRDRRYSE